MTADNNTTSARHKTTKIVKVEDGRGTSNALMITAFNGEEEPILYDEGYRSGYLMFTIFGGPEVISGYRPRKLCRENTILNSDQGIGALCIAIGDDIELFDDLTDGDTIGPDELELMVNHANA